MSTMSITECRRIWRIAGFVLLLLSNSSVAYSAPESQGLGTVTITGVSSTLAKELRTALSLTRLTKAQRKSLSEARLAFFLGRASDEARVALQPLGYYSAHIDVRTEPAGAQLNVLLHIEPGPRLMVGKAKVTISGAAEHDSVVTRALARFTPGPNDRFVDARYETGKRGIDNLLAGRGYFDANLDRHSVQVTRANASADIDLHWTSGIRYGLGAVRFTGSQLRPGLLDALVPWQAGTPYHQSRVIALQRTLTNVDYFGTITITPLPEQAESNNVPIAVALTPALRNVYSAGISLGTDSGAGIQLGAERRWLNDRGHKAETALDFAQHKRSLAFQYKIPAFARFDGWYTLNANAVDQDFAEFNTRTLEGVANRNARFGDWGFTAGTWLKREWYTAADAPRVATTVWYPEVSVQTVRAKDPINPSRGWSLTAQLRGNDNALGSDVSFLQAHVLGKWIMPLTETSRLLLRGEFGTTRTAQLTQLPPSLRFFAGGDQSIRGYGYNTLGEVIAGAAQGGKQLLTGSAEVDYYYTPRWGAAAFVDAGDAFNSVNAFKPALGAGIGLRWRSPAGPIRLDVAHAFSQDQGAWRIHIRFGPDL